MKAVFDDMDLSASEPTFMLSADALSRLSLTLPLSYARAERWPITPAAVRRAAQWRRWQRIRHWYWLGVTR